jgi:WD40 repeat protein
MKTWNLVSIVLLVLSALVVGLSVLTWQAEARNSCRILRGHRYGVNAVAYSPDGRTLVSVGGGVPRTHGGEVKWWDISTGLECANSVTEKAPVEAVAFSADGKIVSTAGYHGVKIWDAAKAQERNPVQESGDYFRTVAFSPDSNRLFSAGMTTGELRIWDVVTGQKRATFRGIQFVAIAPDGRTLATAAQDWRDVRVCSTSTGEELLRFRGHPLGVWNVAFSPDGRTLAVVGNDSTVRCWNTTTGRLRSILLGHTDFVYTVAFSPDGKTLASGGRDRTVRLWDPTMGTEKAVLTGHQGSVKSVAFAPDGEQLASGSFDKTVRLWDLSEIR